MKTIFRTLIIASTFVLGACQGIDLPDGEDDISADTETGGDVDIWLGWEPPPADYPFQLGSCCQCVGGETFCKPSSEETCDAFLETYQLQDGWVNGEVFPDGEGPNGATKYWPGCEPGQECKAAIEACGACGNGVIEENYGEICEVGAPVFDSEDVWLPAPEFPQGLFCQDCWWFYTNV